MSKFLLSFLAGVTLTAAGFVLLDRPGEPLPAVEETVTDAPSAPVNTALPGTEAPTTTPDSDGNAEMRAATTNAEAKPQASNYADHIYSLELPEREAMMLLNEKYHRALEFGSLEEHRWMMNNGFPSLEAITAAGTLTSPELRQLANELGGVYRDLYLDRLINETTAAVSVATAGGADETSFKTSKEYRTMTAHLRKQSHELLKSDSAFSGYVLSRYYTDVVGDPNRGLAALFLANARGDRRALHAIRNFAAKHQISDEVVEAMGTYAALGRLASPPVTNIPR